MDAPELVTLNTTNDIARLVLRRPPLNFLNLDMLRQLESCLEQLGDDPPCRLLVIDSEGAAFSAGLEMSEQTREGIFLLLEKFHYVIRLLNNFARPTLAVIRGMALGAGNEIVACADFVFATERSSFGQPEVKIGTIPSLAHLLLPSLMGTRRAMELILTGNLITAKEAESAGLINRVVPDSLMDGAVEAMASTFRALSAPVVALALHAAREARTRDLETRLRESESVYLNQLMDLEDTAEGIRAFIEKRVPQWRNR